MRISTLCYLERDGKYLMLHRVKKKNDINHDKWIGVGGGLEEGETPLDCVCREVWEETGYTLSNPSYRGILYFYPVPGEDEIIHVYTCGTFSGTEKVCDEGDLVWVDKQKVPDLPTWEGDALFLPLLARDTPFFELHLHYAGDELKKAILDGQTVIDRT